MLIVAIITLSTAFIPTNDNIKSKTQADLMHPEAGYFEEIGR